MTKKGEKALASILALEQQAMESSAPRRSTDEELFSALKARDQTALATLYDRHGRMVYGLSLKILKNPQEAEDLTQEIFLALWKNAERNPDCRHCVSYLVTMTRSRSIDKIRKRGRQLKLLERWGRSERTHESAIPLDHVLTGERSEQVRDALTQLPEPQRAVIEMAYNQGLSQVEIAQQLQLPLGTVKTRTRQGLIKLRRLLTPFLSLNYEQSL